MPHKNKSRFNRPQKKKGPSLEKALIDRSINLADGTVGNRSDRFEIKPIGNLPPTRIPRDFSHQGYWYKGTTELTALTTSTTVPVASSYNFKLSDLFNYTSYTGCFDQYSIVEVVFRLLPQNNVAATSGARPNTLISLIDHDDSSGITSIGQAQEYSSNMTTTGMVGHTRVVQPRFANAVYAGAFTSFGNIRGYIDAANASVQHYGVKIYAGQSQGQQYTYTVDCDYIVHFRDTH